MRNCVSFLLFVFSKRKFWNDIVASLRTASVLWASAGSFGQFAGVAALITRLRDKFTEETLQYLFLLTPLWSLWFKYISLKENIYF